jgi:hypothetical protein
MGSTGRDPSAVPIVEVDRLARSFRCPARRLGSARIRGERRPGRFLVLWVRYSISMQADGRWIRWNLGRPACAWARVAPFADSRLLAAVAEERPKRRLGSAPSAVKTRSCSPGRGRVHRAANHACGISPVPYAVCGEARDFAGLRGPRRRLLRGTCLAVPSSLMWVCWATFPPTQPATPAWLTTPSN